MNDSMKENLEVGAKKRVPGASADFKSQHQGSTHLVSLKVPLLLNSNSSVVFIM